jgi:hypothetical protein
LKPQHAFYTLSHKLAVRPVKVVAGVLGVLLLGCGKGESKSSASAGHASLSNTRAESIRVTSRAESVATARDVWNKAEVVRRLAEAGLVVIDPHERAQMAGVHVTGDQLQVSGSRLEIYVYFDAASRQRDSGSLDTTTRVIAAAERPRYIIAGNLLAVLYTPNDRLAERVENALTARHLGS